MVSWRLRRCIVKAFGNIHSTFCPGRFHSTKVSKPLRILFCGSDDFSSESLRALHAQHQRDSGFIKSIDVLCRPGKPSGRAMKIREVPIKAVAHGLNLEVHERDTFTGWELPKPQGEHINLIIAVSFGLFVPPRILKAAEYGGLNVHPSLLPNFRGPSPLQYTIMTGESRTGVTLQTLDDKSFDHGIIIAQTPPPGLPISPDWTYDSLLKYISPKAAELLVWGLQQRLFVLPIVEVGGSTPSSSNMSIVHAPKITPEDRKMVLWKWTSSISTRRERALGRLWTNICIDRETTKRLIWEGLASVRWPPVFSTWFQHLRNGTFNLSRGNKDNGDGEVTPVPQFLVYPIPEHGLKSLAFYIEDGDAIIIALSQQSALRVEHITIEGKSRQSARTAMRSLRSKGTWNVREDPVKVKDASIWAVEPASRDSQENALIRL